MIDDGFPLDIPTRRRDGNDRLIPLINVVFLLLAFFMVAGTIRAADTLKVDVPGVRSTGTIEGNAVTLYIDAAGTIALGHETMPLEAAITRLRDHVSDDPDVLVYLKADRTSPSDVILPVLRQLSDAGVTRLQLVAVNRGKRQ